LTQIGPGGNDTVHKRTIRALRQVLQAVTDSGPAVYGDFKVSCEWIADNYGMRSGSLSGEYFVTHHALAHTLTEHHECLSRLVYSPARRKDVFPYHAFGSPFIDEDGSRADAGNNVILRY
jgi:hypothetical protein